MTTKNGDFDLTCQYRREALLPRETASRVHGRAQAAPLIKLTVFSNHMPLGQQYMNILTLKWRKIVSAPLGWLNLYSLLRQITIIYILDDREFCLGL